MKQVLIFVVVSIALVSSYPENFASENETRNGKIIGGTLAKLGQFPYQAGLFENTFQFCGGSIISDVNILTAAHCLIDRQSLEVRLGFISIVGRPEFYDFIKDQKQIVIHENYTKSSKFSDDIGLVITNKQILYSANIRNINIPLMSDISFSLVGKTGKVSGFGRTSDGSPSGSMDLLWAESTFEDNKICEGVFAGIVEDSNLCFSAKAGKGACFGDSGGPVTAMVNGRHIIVGLVSFGGSTCESGLPNVFTRISSYLTWISRRTAIPIY